MKLLAPLFLLLAASLGHLPAQDAPAPSDSGPTLNQFLFEQGGRHVPVRYYLPAGATPDAPVLIVMHGVKRNAETYLHEWTGYADQCHFLLIVPEFSEAEFPGSRGYQDGNLATSNGQPLPRDQSTYNMIEPIFDQVCQRTGNTSQQYSIYGHSAGAQFVHRFVAFVPQARILHAVSANAGSYLLPDATQAFPFGFARSGLGDDALRAFLAKPLIVLLGTADIHPDDPELPHEPGADAQGPYRLERGKNFFASGQSAAATLGTPFGWTLSFAPDIGHSDKGMAPFAVKLLFPQ